MADDVTPRERWIAVLTRQQVDRPPLDYWGTDEVTAKLMKHLKVKSHRELYESLDIDVPYKVEPKYTGQPIPYDEDIFGCKYRDVDYGTGSYRECIYNPLAGYKTVEEIEKNYAWPNINDYDFSVVKEQADLWNTYPEPFGASHSTEPRPSHHAGCICHRQALDSLCHAPRARQIRHWP